jgi:hypothetical protein
MQTAMMTDRLQGTFWWWEDEEAGVAEGLFEFRVGDDWRIEPSRLRRGCAAPSYQLC